MSRTQDPSSDNDQGEPAPAHHPDSQPPSPPRRGSGHAQQMWQELAGPLPSVYAGGETTSTVERGACERSRPDLGLSVRSQCVAAV